MAWSDPPTDSQVCSLGLDYESCLVDAETAAKSCGAIAQADAIREALEDGVVRDIIRRHNRKEASKEIAIVHYYENMPNESIWKDIVAELDNRGVDLPLFLKKFAEED